MLSCHHQHRGGTLVEILEPSPDLSLLKSTLIMVNSFFRQVTSYSSLCTRHVAKHLQLFSPRITLPLQAAYRTRIKTTSSQLFLFHGPLLVQGNYIFLHSMKLCCKETSFFLLVDRLATFFSGGMETLGPVVPKHQETRFFLRVEAGVSLNQFLWFLARNISNCSTLSQPFQIIFMG